MEYKFDKNSAGKCLTRIIFRHKNVNCLLYNFIKLFNAFVFRTY